MSKSRLPDPILILLQTVQWFLLAALVGILAGSASAFFLVTLDWVTDFRESHVWIIALLPLAGLFMGLIYHYFGKSVENGNSLIIDEIHDPRVVLPIRLAPLVLLATLVTHLFGGSAGREGTAVQMGASLADQLGKPFRFSKDHRRLLLMAGLSAGFASVFGTPLAGAVFGLEVLAIGRMRYEALFPCFIAAIVGDQVTRAWGVHHSRYSFPDSLVVNISLSGLLSAILAGAVFGVVGMLFAKSTHKVSKWFSERISYMPFRPLVGGALVALAVGLMGSTKYIGLGLPTMLNAFQIQLGPWDFIGKFGFTVLTLGSGFKGGEVTPLFFIGATLGNSLALVLPLAFPLLAAMGFVAVFAGAANVPLASTLMAMELFGSHIGIYAGIACVSSYLFSGHAGIYHTQRIGHRKV